MEGVERHRRASPPRSRRGHRRGPRHLLREGRGEGRSHADVAGQDPATPIPGQPGADSPGGGAMTEDWAWIDAADEPRYTPEEIMRVADWLVREGYAKPGYAER